MILPAVLLRIDAFLDKNNKETNEPTKKLLVTSDSGKQFILNLKSNKSDLTDTDVKNFLEEKTNSLIKDKEIREVASQLEYSEKYIEELENFKEEQKAKGLKLKEVANALKTYKEEKAKAIVKERRKIKKNTIFRAPLDFFRKKDKTIVYNSKCILLNDDRKALRGKENSITGFYIFSQTANALPVLIEPVIKNNEFKELYSIRVSPLATFEHITYLLGHLKRSAQKNLENGSVFYTPYFYFRHNDFKKQYQKDFIELGQLFNTYKTFLKEKEKTDLNKYIKFLKFLYVLLKREPKAIPFVDIKLNLLFTKTEMQELYFKSNSPALNSPEAIVNLNASKENPEIKQTLKDMLKKYYEGLFFNGANISLNAIYHFPAINIAEEPDSWGFMKNNIKANSFVWSAKDTLNAIKFMEEELKNG